MTMPESFPLPPIPPADPPAPVQSGPWFYAQLADGVCTSVTEAAGPLEGEHLVRLDALDTSLLGQVWDGEEWSSPTAVPAPRHITQLAFQQRFTDAEAIAIDIASIGATVPAATVRRYLSLVQAARYIDLDRADTRAGVRALETAGLLEDGRSDEILDAPVQAQERP